MGCKFTCIKNKSEKKKSNKKHNLKLNNINSNNINSNNMNSNNMNLDNLKNKKINYTIKKEELINEEEYFKMKTKYNKKKELKYDKIGKFYYKKENKIHFKNIYKLINENELVSTMCSPKMCYINIYEPDGLYSYQKNKKFNKEFWSNISTLKSRVLLKRQQFYEKQKKINLFN